MGLLVNGVWKTGWYDTEKTGGRFVRESTTFHGVITADGSSGFPAETRRYHLYVSLACPWAHRTLLFRKFKGLEDAVSVSVVDPYMGDQGWAFREGPGNVPDVVNGCAFLREVYSLAEPRYTGRVTVPVLWDKKTATLVNNESAEIIRMFNGAFDGIVGSSIDLYPEDLRGEIDEVNARVYENVNDGVYRAGFATTQEAYEEAVDALFSSLHWLDERLASRRYLCGSRITEADWRLFTTLVRFDVVYYGHFKCNLRRIADYPNLSNYLRELYQKPGVAGTCDFDHIKRHYYGSHRTINPSGIVPKGPELSLSAPHDRARL